MRGPTATPRSRRSPAASASLGLPIRCWSTARTASSPATAVLAARKLGLTDVPCIEVADLTAAQQRRAYIGEEARRKSRLVDEGSGHDQRVELLLVEPLRFQGESARGSDGSSGFGEDEQIVERLRGEHVCAFEDGKRA